VRSYKEIIKGDNFHCDDEYPIDTKMLKMCWGCEKKSKTGHMVWNASKFRRIFFCEDCFTKLKQ
jgi:hypothetical protein